MFRSKRKTASRRNFAANGAEYTQLYPTRLSFYDMPPLEEITLEQFEQWAGDRLRVLTELQSLGLRQKNSKEMETLMKPMLNKYLPLTNNPDTEYAERQKDHYSHFILLLVFCRSEELRRRFIKNEVALFKLRYQALLPKEQQQFVQNYSEKLPWHYISEEEKQANLDNFFRASGSSIRNHLLLETSAESVTDDQVRQYIAQTEQFIKVPFEKVPKLVGQRLVYMSKGEAYLPLSMQTHMLANEFANFLEQKLIATVQQIPLLEEDDRLTPMITHLADNFSNSEGYQPDVDGDADITAAKITSAQLRRHYPLCAKRMLDGLVATSKLQYDARTQLGLFLKGIGLGVDEALVFWRTQFTKDGRMNNDTFTKNYVYNINHSYGLNGSRINYKPWNCSTVFNKPRPLRSQFHGCPYRDLPRPQLEDELRELKLNDQEVRSVADMVDGNGRGPEDWTAACTRVFELTHPGTQEEHIDHPNLYFDRSRQYWDKRETAAS